MSETPNLNLPYIMPAQAQKHVTHNEAIRALDVVVQLAVLDRDLAAPPVAPADGQRYIVAASPTGPWAGRTGQIAAWQDGAWSFFQPNEGWLAWVSDEDEVYVFDGSGWVLANGSGGSVNPTPLVGVNATADASNRLTVASPASLFTHAGAGHQTKINKATPADTASQLFQTNFSGRAEVGLTGDDDLHVKVSADGSSWNEALVIGRTTGAVAHRSGARHTFQHAAASSGLRLLPAAGDPAEILDGDVWYNATAGRLRKRESGLSTDLDHADSVEGRSGARMLSVHQALHQAYAFTRGSFAAPRVLKLLTIGDSVGTSVTSILAPDWQRRMGGSILGAASTLANEGQGVAGLKIAPLTIASGSANLISNAYQYGHAGQYYDLVVGADVSWGTGGAVFPWTKAKIYYIKEPGAGTLTVFANGVNVATANAADAAIGLGVVTVSNANPAATSPSGTSLRTTTAGGGVKVLYVVASNTTVNGVWHFDATLGGLSLNQAMQHASGQAITQAMIADFAPDVLWYEMKEAASYASEGLGPFTFQQRFEQLAEIMAVARPKSCDVVVVSSNAYVPRAGYDPNQQAAAIATRDTLRAVSANRNFLYFDGYASLGEQAVLREFVYGSSQPIPLAWRGEYDAAATYAVNDVVAANFGSVFRYINTVPTAGIALATVTHWRQQWTAYSAAATYAVNDIVTSGLGAWSYINATPGTGVAPPALPVTSNTHWQYLAAFNEDGTHPAVVANAYRAAVFNAQTGISSNPYTFVVSAVNETGIASKLASGTIVTAGKTGQELRIRTDNAAVAYSWFLDVPQRFSVFETLDNPALCMMSLWRFGNNNGTNLLQYAAYLGGAIALDGDGSGVAGTAGNAILRSNTVAGQAGSAEVWHRTNNVAGNLSVGALVADKWIKLKSYTKTTVPAAATAGAGALIWVTDTNGGAKVCASNGTGWRMLSDAAMA